MYRRTTACKIEGDNMGDFTDLSVFTLHLLLFVGIITPQIKTINPKKTKCVRWCIILSALAVYLVVVIVNLQPIPANGDEIVYLTRTGSKYHASDCRHLSESQIPTSLERAIADGYGDCYHCSVPKYIPETIYPSFFDLYSSEGVLILVCSLGVISLFYGIPFLMVYLEERKNTRR